MNNHIGYVHSIETFATFEGYGIRYAVFLEGCPLRCVYCHNPDTWAVKSGNAMSVDELLADAIKYEKYYKGGGVTFSGGEPLAQSEFLEDAAKSFKNRGFSVAIDTSAGVIPYNINAIAANIDLAIVDLKFHNEKDYKNYCGGSLANTSELLKILNNHGIEVWLRTVILPGINDTESDIAEYASIAKQFKIDRYELLGYHTMGVYKYKELGLPYKLDGIEALSEARLIELKNALDKAMM